MGQTRATEQQLAVMAAQHVARQCDILNILAEYDPQIAAEVFQERITAGSPLAEYILNASAAEVLLNSEMKQVVLLLREGDHHGAGH